MAEKRKYRSWSQDDMRRALAAYRNGDCGFNEACRRYEVPKPTLKRHLDEKNAFANEDSKFAGRPPIFSDDIESELADHILRMHAHMFGLTMAEVRKLAFQIAEINSIPHTFNQSKMMAGKDWYYKFMARHPNLSLRQPENTSMARAKGFNRQNVNEYFDILEKICDQEALDGTRTFNVDESGFSTVQKKGSKVIAPKGCKQVGNITSGERGVNTTIVCCANAAGLFVPPMIIFKRMRMVQELKVGAPPGSIVHVSETGYINSELFCVWLKHFIATVHPTPEKKILLCLDGHTTHTRNLEALQLCRDNGIIMLQLPGHTTHRLQPLDVAFFKPLETYYSQAVEKWLRTNLGLCVTQYQVTQLLGEAYAKAASVENAMSAFRGAGLWPVDRHRFNDTDFAAADALTAKNIPEEIVDNPEPIPQLADVTNRSSTSSLIVPVAEISPLPELKKSKRMKKEAQRAVELTSSPYKNDLQAKKENQKPKVNAKAKRNLKKLKLSSTETDNETTEKPDGLQLKKEDQKKKDITKCKKTIKKMKLSQTTAKPVESTSTNDITIDIDEEEWYCGICDRAQIKDMIRCCACNGWYHEACSGCKPGTKKYLCFSCK